VSIGICISRGWGRGGKLFATADYRSLLKGAQSKLMVALVFQHCKFVKLMRSLVRSCRTIVENKRRQSRSKRARGEKTDCFRLVPIGSDWSRLVPIGPDWSRLVSIGSDWFRLSDDWLSRSLGTLAPRSLTLSLSNLGRISRVSSCTRAARKPRVVLSAGPHPSSQPRPTGGKRRPAIREWFSASRSVADDDTTARRFSPSLKNRRHS
jgi:hypothetical protein